MCLGWFPFIGVRGNFAWAMSMIGHAERRRSMATIQLGTCNLHYTRAGNGSVALLFVHGGFCDDQDWVYQVKDLQEEFTVVTYDQRCHGLSEAPYDTCSVEQFATDVHALIDALDLRKTIVIGHSLGARVTIQAAADKPDHLLGIVLVDGSRLTKGNTVDEVKRVEATRLGENPADYLEYRFRAMFFDNADPELRDRIILKATATPREAIEAIASGTGYWDALGLETALPRIPSTLPVLAIQATHHDEKTERYALPPHTTTTPWLDLLRSHMPQLQVKITPMCGHFNMVEAAEDVNDAIRSFARSLG